MLTQYPDIRKWLYHFSCNCNALNNKPNLETASVNMYQVGWNLIWFTKDSANFMLIAYPNFSTSPNMEMFSITNYTPQDHAILGGAENGSRTYK